MYCYNFQGIIEYEGTFADLQNRHIDFLNMLSEEEHKEDLEIVESENQLDIINNGNSRDDEDAEPQETEELMAKGNLASSLYWRYFRAGGSILMILCFVIALVLGQTGSSGSDYWVAYWLISSHSYSSFLMQIIYTCLAYLVS